MKKYIISNYEMIEKIKGHDRNITIVHALEKFTSKTESYIFNDSIAAIITPYGDENHCTIINLNGNFISEEDIYEMLLFLDEKNITCIRTNMLEADENQIQIYDSVFCKKFIKYDNKKLGYIKSKSTNNGILDNKNIRLLTENDEYLFNKFPQEQIKYRPSPSILFDVFIKEADGSILVFIDDNCIKGYLSFGLLFSNIYDVDYIYVLPEYRNQQIGRQLALYFSELLLKEDNVGYWTCRSENIQSSKTALNAGFICCREEICYNKV